MKVYLLILLLLAGYLCQAQDKRHVFCIHLAPSLGVGLSGRTEEMTGGALMAALALPLEFGKQWYLIPEAYIGDFRSPMYPYKVGFLIASYPILHHNAYAVRLGKGFKFKVTIPQISFRFSAGVGLLLVHEPCCVYFNPSRSYHEMLYRTWVVPVQLDMRFRLTKKEKSFLVFGCRWDANGRRAFGSLNAGLQTRLWSAK